MADGSDIPWVRSGMTLEERVEETIRKKNGEAAPKASMFGQMYEYEMDSVRDQYDTSADEILSQNVQNAIRIREQQPHWGSNTGKVNYPRSPSYSGTSYYSRPKQEPQPSYLYAQPAFQQELPVHQSYSPTPVNVASVSNMPMQQFLDVLDQAKKLQHAFGGSDQFIQTRTGARSQEGRSQSPK